jgi:hypothetical protein
MARLMIEIHDDPERLSRERFVNQFDIDQQSRGDQVFSKEFAGKAGDHVDPELVGSDLNTLDEGADQIVTYVDKHVAHSDARPMAVLPTFEELNNAIDVVGELFKKYFLLITVDSYLMLEPTPQYDWEASFREPWLRD